MTTFTCALCGDELEGAPDEGLTVPPACAELVDGGGTIDPRTVHGVVSIDLCPSCADIARRMVLEYDTSPLPECDGDAVRYNERGTTAAFADTTSGDPGERLVEDAITTVEAFTDGGTERLRESRLLEARTVVLSLDELETADAGRE